MRVCVVGTGRSLEAASLVKPVLDWLHARHPITRLLTGFQSGALASQLWGWAIPHKVAVDQYGVDLRWHRNGGRHDALVDRSRRMIVNSDLVVALPGGKSTEVNIAKDIAWKLVGVPILVGELYSGHGSRRVRWTWIDPVAAREAEVDEDGRARLGSPMVRYPADRLHPGVAGGSGVAQADREAGGDVGAGAWLLRFRHPRPKGAKDLARGAAAQDRPPTVAPE